MPKVGGVRVSRDEKEGEHLDAKGCTRVPASLLQSLTAQEAADLFEYVATLR